jgi:hypothetical protein
MSKIKKFFLMQYWQDIKLAIQIALFYFFAIRTNVIYSDNFLIYPERVQ